MLIDNISELIDKLYEKKNKSELEKESMDVLVEVFNWMSEMLGESE